MRSNHDDRPAAASEEGRGHGAEAVKCSRQVRGDHLGPIFFTLSKQEMTTSDSGIADKHRRHRHLAAGGCHHLFHRTRLANIGFVDGPGSTGGYHLREGALGRCLVSVVMHPDRPASRRKGQADRSTNPSRCTGHKYRMSLVHLVHLVCLVDLVYLVGLVQPNKRDKPNNTLLTAVDYGWEIMAEGKPAMATLPTPSLAAPRIPMIRSSHCLTSGGLAHAAEETGIPKDLYRGHCPAPHLRHLVAPFARKIPASSPSPPTIFRIRSGTNGTIVVRLLKGLCKRSSINFSPTCPRSPARKPLRA